MKYLLTIVMLLIIGLVSASKLIEQSGQNYVRGYQAGFTAGEEVVQKNLWLLIKRPGVKKCYKTTQN